MPKIVKKKMKKTKNFQKFKHYSELPPELRIMIVDEMEPADRCRFSGCSRTSNKDAKSSKKYIYSLELHGGMRNIRIHVVHGEYDCMNKMNTGYVLEFKEESEKKYMKYSNFFEEEQWRIEMSIDTDLHNLALEYFERMLQFYQNKIRKLTMMNLRLSRIFNIQSLRNLEVLETYFIQNILQFLSILRRPLKILNVYEQNNNQLFRHYEFSQVQHSLRLRYFKFDITQYLQLQAKEIITHIGELTEMDIFNIVEGWRNGAIGQNWKFCEWELKGSTFNTQKMLGLLGIYNKNPYEELIFCDFKHKIEEKKTVTLVFDPHSVILINNDKFDSHRSVYSL